MTIHPKALGAGFGGTVGTLIVSVLQSFPDVHLAATLPAAIGAFCAALGAVLAPGGNGSTSSPAAVSGPEAPSEPPIQPPPVGTV